MLAPEGKFKEFKAPEPSIPNSPGFYKEWTNAILGLAKEPPTCNFEYSGPLAETVLLGNVAYRVGKPFDWDAEKLVAVGVPEAEQYIRPEFYNGYKVVNICTNNHLRKKKDLRSNFCPKVFYIYYTGHYAAGDYSYRYDSLIRTRPR